MFAIILANYNCIFHRYFLFSTSLTLFIKQLSIRTLRLISFTNIYALHRKLRINEIIIALPRFMNQQRQLLRGIYRKSSIKSQGGLLISSPFDEVFMERYSLFNFIKRWHAGTCQDEQLVFLTNYRSYCVNFFSGEGCRLDFSSTYGSEDSKERCCGYGLQYRIFKQPKNGIYTA